TGRPKGAVLSHYAVTNQIFQLSDALDIRHSRYLGIMPLFHAAAAVSMFTNFATGTTSHIVRDFDPAETVRLLDETRIGFTTIAPAMIAMLLQVPGVADRRFAHLDLMVYGASAIAPDLLRRAMAVFGCDFCQGYGMTETTAGATILSRADHRRALEGEEALLRSAGRPLLGTEVRVVDAGDTPVATGTVGEIVVRGPQVMDGYWNQAEASASALQGGWMHTGDAGYLDDEGYLYIADRITDMYISGGENVYPREVEDVLFGLGGVADVAVIGVPDDRWGEVGKAIVVTASGASLDEAEVIAFCRGRLAGYKCPRSVEFWEGLPRNATGKVLKREVRAQCSTQLERAVSR
ncbi:MAG: AMP-binding protein, partial [Candidatus Dormibacteria bacterium]